MENENEPQDKALFLGEESNSIWSDLHEFFLDSDDDFLEL